MSIGTGIWVWYLNSQPTRTRIAFASTPQLHRITRASRGAAFLVLRVQGNHCAYHGHRAQMMVTHLGRNGRGRTRSAEAVGGSPHRPAPLARDSSAPDSSECAARVQGVAETVADEVDREHGQEDHR